MAHELDETTPIFAIGGKTVFQNMGVGTQDIIWENNAVGGGVVPVGLTSFTLVPNHTYELRAVIKSADANVNYIATWVDAANNPVGLFPPTVHSPDSGRHEIYVEQVFTPLVATDVKLRIQVTAGATNIREASYLSIRNLT